jgi:hypothetical protein
VYLGSACFDVLLIVLFCLAPMPEITDADMHVQEGRLGRIIRALSGSRRICFWRCGRSLLCWCAGGGCGEFS